jgi:hypothetical protein
MLVLPLTLPEWHPKPLATLLGTYQRKQSPSHSIFYICH